MCTQASLERARLEILNAPDSDTRESARANFRRQELCFQRNQQAEATRLAGVAMEEEKSLVADAVDAILNPDAMAEADAMADADVAMNGVVTPAVGVGGFVDGIGLPSFTTDDSPIFGGVNPIYLLGGFAVFVGYLAYVRR